MTNLAGEEVVCAVQDVCGVHRIVVDACVVSTLQPVEVPVGLTGQGLPFCAHVEKNVATSSAFGVKFWSSCFASPHGGARVVWAIHV